MPSWRPVPGYEGLYEVSSEGTVLSLPRIDSLGRAAGDRILSPQVTRKGYLTVHLYRDGTARTRYVHDLVSAAFNGPKPPGMEVRHWDGDKSNNRPANLIYGTSSDNKHDSVRLGTDANVSKTHCPQNHPYSGANLLVTSRGTRQCRICKRQSTREATRRYRVRKNAELTEGK